ncbi:FKBP-type peptidyl-prolyl cis-trans isomerase [Candidatus Vallotia lariciata]|uniref:FKBP-type peptidyl-prolyl cis-trans isomerase n=1 Tax=Candidatus Vallotia laricis TaxID=2018052 RepID=UPI001D005AC3|nr:peptidylprolyl isomerase [Candidatus Vallotia lariciata]UDG83005.1 FKBP-type peptidyl-prolyl cis-trans isomerase SlyD [Candidatus Vallotia lariciata]
MKIVKHTVVSVSYKLSDTQGNVIEDSDKPMVYLHGGYNGTFPKIEKILEGHETGFSAQIHLEPVDAFGNYDSEQVKIEPREKFPEPLEVGMQFEGIAESVGGDEIDTVIYTVTDLTKDRVILDGNHPLAGMALRFSLTVKDVRDATTAEVEQKRAHDNDGLIVTENNYGLSSVLH